MESSGLTSAAAKEYLAAHGYNEIVEKKDSLAVKIIKRGATPVSGMLALAAALSFVGGKDFDGFFILVLLVINIAITVWQEHKADNAIEELNKGLSVEVKVRRDGAWSKLPARQLAVGDVIELRSGGVVPADAAVLEANAVSANEAALTGESLAKDKRVGDTLYSGSFLASGLVTARVSATGGNTYFGSVLGKVDVRDKQSSLERQILRISQLLSALSLVAVALLTWLLWAHGTSWLEILQLDLSLVIAGIPISLPTVMTLIIAFGVVALARKGVVVRRLSSLQELADADYLLTDKTGTLTQNKITVDAVKAYGAADEAQVVRLAAAVAQHEPDTAMNQAILARAKGAPSVRTRSYIPGDSTRKRSTATLEDNGLMTLSLGAPQVIADLCALSSEARQRFDQEVDDLAERGYRALALARVAGEQEGHMELVGLLSLSDVLRPDAKEVVQFLADNGVGVTMVTGDNRAIAKEIAGKLGLPGGNIITPQSRPEGGWAALSKDDFSATAAFAEILPEDKYDLIRSAKRFYKVAANGDGINDLPAVKEAGVGFAVEGAVDALRAAADIVLTSEGISVMRDAFIEGRRIFMRLYAYSVYRISESFRLIVTIAILGVLVGSYPLSPLQLILIALLNDIPIISLAGNRVRVANRPSRLNLKDEFGLSILFGLVGVVESLLLYFFALDVLHLPLPVTQTLFFLKLTVSGHLLIYVAHTKERWWRYLPSGSVLLATGLTQAAATLLAVTGFLMPAAISWPLAALVWGWTLVFMQIEELVKVLRDGKAAR